MSVTENLPVETPLSPHPPASLPRAAVGDGAIGALATGALALGALAIGALVIGRLSVRSARFKRLIVDHLEVGQIKLRQP